MPRPRKPSNILEMTGAYKKNPQRKRPNKPKAKRGISIDPPETFEPDQKQAWKDIIERCPDKVLMNSDELTVEMASVMLARFRQDGAQTPSHILTRLDIILDRMGMTPSGREKLTVPQDNENEFDGI